MILHKYKRSIHFIYAIKHLISASFNNDLHLIVISATVMFVLLMLFKRNHHLIWNHLRIMLLLELCFYDPPFTPVIVATLNFTLPHKWIILLFYTIRVAIINAQNFKIVDWVYFSMQFLALMLYLWQKSRKPQIQLTQLTTPKHTYVKMGPTLESTEVFDLLNYMPLGVCLLDHNLTMVNSNYKANKYVSKVVDGKLEQALFMMIQKAYLQMQSIGSCKRNERHKSIFESIDDQGSDFHIKRLHSVSYPRKRDISMKVFSNMSDIAQIINKHKSKNISESNLNTLKYKEPTTGKTFEIKIFEIQSGNMVILENITNKESQLDMQDRYIFQSKLINSFSHELRTPLNCSLQLLQILGQNLKSELNDQYLKPAIISNKKLLHQINDILDYANFEAQAFKLRRGYFKLSTVISTIKDYFQAECEQKQIKLTIKSCDDTYINSDYDRIMQIIVNLMNNSVKYTRQNGEIQFIVQRAGSIYQFEVYDTGCGIQIEKLYLITRILKNCELDWSRRGDEDYLQYVGLGLKVSSQIARKLCDTGELSITSSLNQFTKGRFQVRDLRKYDDSFTIPTDDQIQEPYQSVCRMKCQCANVLICDDIPFNHMALATVLKFYKIKCDNAYDGQMAIDMVKNKFNQCNCGYKLIFMDIDMPGIDGCQATKEIQAFFQAKQINCVVVMCSAFDSKENIDYAMKSGMKEILPKPVDTNQLKKILQKYYF